MADEYDSGGSRQDSYNGKLDLDKAKGRILGRDQNSVPRLQIIADGDQFNMKVSQEGSDATTASDDELIFNSDNNLFKIVLSGITSISPPSSWQPGGAGVQTVTIPHNLGFSPAVLAYVTNPNVVGVSDYGVGLGALPNPLFLINSYYAVIQSAARVDNTNLYIELVFLNQGGTNLSGANAYTWNYKYYLLQETAS